LKPGAEGLTLQFDANATLPARLRAAGSACNPYLGVALVLIASLESIDRENARHLKFSSGRIPSCREAIGGVAERSEAGEAPRTR